MTEGSNQNPLDAPVPAGKQLPFPGVEGASQKPVSPDAVPVIAAPTEAEPVSNQSAEAKSAEVKPVESNPVENNPVATTNVASEVLPAVTNPAMAAGSRQSNSKLPLVLGALAILAAAIGVLVYLQPFSNGSSAKKPSFYETEIQENKELVNAMRKEVEELRTNKRELDSKLDEAQREFDLQAKEKEKVKAELDSFSFYEFPKRQLRSATLVSATRLAMYMPAVVGHATSCVLLSCQENLPERDGGGKAAKPQVDLETQAQKESLDQLREELKALRKEKEQIEAATHEAKRKIESLKRDVESVKDSIASESKQLEEIRRFQTADFVVLDPELFVVGLVDSGDGYKLVGKASNSVAKLAGNAVKKWNKPIIASEPKLAAQIHRLETDQELSTSLKDKLDELWGSRSFFPEVEGEKIQYVNFVDLDTNRQRLGFYLKHDENTLSAFTIDGKIEQIKKLRVVPGTARVAAGDKLIRTENDFQILDFCACEIARLLSGNDDKEQFVKSVPPNVVVYVKIDLPESHFDVFRTISGKMFWASDRYKNFDSLQQQLEDDLQVKLGKLGVKVLERENLDAIIGEQKLSAEFDNEEILGQMTFATHVFICEVAESSNGTGYKINVRLADVRTSEQLWQESYDRPRTRLVENQKYDLSSGRLAVVNVVKKRPEEWRPLREAKLTSRLGELETQLLIMEKTSAGNSKSDSIRARNLFSMQIEDLPKKYIRNADSKLVKSADDVPPECMLQYMCWKIRQKTMPLAGLLTQVNDSDDSSFVMLDDAKSIVKRGDRVNIFRVNTYVETSNDSEVINRLPLNATVLEVQNGGFRISTEASDVVTLWTGTEGLVAGDLVCPPSQADEHKFVVRDFTIGMPPPSVLKELGSSRQRREEFYRISQSVAKKFGQDFHAMLGEADLTMLPFGADPKTSGATHIVSAELIPVSRREFRVRVIVRKAGSEEQVMSEEFSLRRNFVIQGK
ncbi:MAG: hypothetical protein AB8B55_15070 [Mariniblastus sp.]